MAVLFNTFKFDKMGNLLQIDDIIALNPNPPIPPMPPVPPEPPVPPRPSSGLADNVMQFRFSGDSYDPSQLPGAWSKVTDTEGNVWNCELHGDDLTGTFKNKFNNPSDTYVELVGTGYMAGVTRAANLFSGCTALTKVGIINFSDTEYVMEMFSGCTALASVEPLYLDGNGNVKGMFKGCSALTEIEVVRAPDTWTMEAFLQDCTSLITARLNMTSSCKYITRVTSECTSLTTIDLGDTSNIRDMAIAFYNCANLVAVSPIDAGRCDNYASYMFYNCKKLTSIQISNTGKIQDMDYMFYGCINLETLPPLDVASLVNAKYMFAHCEKLKAVEFIHTAKPTDVTQMFRNCYELKSLPFMNTSRARSFSHFAHRCYSLESFPAYDTSSATELSRIASCCPKLTSFPLLNTSKATDIGSMLAGHGASYETDYVMHIAELPAFDFSNVTNAENAFGNNHALKHIPAYSMPKVTDVSNMYLDCPNVESGLYKAYAMYRDMATPPATTANFAKNCGSATETGSLEASVIPSTWGGTGISLPPYTLRFKFSDAEYDPTISSGVTKGSWTKVSGESDNLWDWTYENSNWDDAFYNKFSTLSNQVDILGSGDLSQVTSMQYMFESSPAIHSIKLMHGAPNMYCFCLQGGGNGGGPESIVIAGLERTTNLHQAFYSCSNLTTLELIGDIGVGHNDVDMYSMCMQCTKLPYLRPLDTSHASNLQDAFRVMLQLKSVPPFNVDSATNVNSMLLLNPKVETGSYALYQKLAALPDTQLVDHAYCFQNCGTGTETGSAELALIPDGWK